MAWRGCPLEEEEAWLGPAACCMEGLEGGREEGPRGLPGPKGGWLVLGEAAGAILANEPSPREWRGRSAGGWRSTGRERFGALPELFCVVFAHSWSC